MNKLSIALSKGIGPFPGLERETISLENADLTQVSAIILSPSDAKGDVATLIESTGFSIPVFVCGLPQEAGHFAPWNPDQEGVQLIDSAASGYESNLLPPFFSTLVDYVQQKNAQFDCPGHQSGKFFRRHPTGRAFYDFFGESIFRADLCNADVALGDLLIHEGAPNQAQQAAARIYNADKTYFVLNGTSASNKVVLNAALTPGDLVLFDRNNHKSNHHGALLQAGATPIYLETARNPYGFIGGIDQKCFDEAYLRERIREVSPEKADSPRPFRLAVIQLGTYDGTIYNARQVVDAIGHLCDYILFDSAWVGYEQFIPMMKPSSPLLLELGPDDPGIFVTQSVHKQQAGFSQTSQIHKKDAHLKGQKRYIPHKRFNNAFMMHASTSPFYPLFAALDVNARMHAGMSGIRLWDECVKVGIRARKSLLGRCEYIRPFIPNTVHAQAWESYPTETIANDLTFFKFEPDASWHHFEGYGKDQYFVDPCKFLLTTPGIDPVTGEYADFGVPATILANFLRENNIVPEKCDLNSILFLLTPAEDDNKMDRLIDKIDQFETYLREDARLSTVLPSLYRTHEKRYAGYTLRQLCQELHDFYRSNNVKTLQKRMFREADFPKRAMAPQAAHIEFMRGHSELISLHDAQGRIALEGALPYPPGVLCCVPGEVWGGPVLDYFLTLLEGIKRFPGFSPEIQGVYIEENNQGELDAFAYVLPKEEEI